MKMGIKIASLATAALFAGAVTAAASTLSINGGSTVALDSSFNPGPSYAGSPLDLLGNGISDGDDVTNFSGTDVGLGQGLSVSSAVGRSFVTFTYLGKEAGYNNYALETTSAQMLTDDTPGDSIVFQAVNGIIAFGFKT